MIRFGPAGNSDSFYEEGYKSSIQMPKWLHIKGLNAYEYQASRGVNIGEKTASKIGQEADKYDIYMSIHAPYYINLSTVEDDKKEKTKDYFFKSLELAGWLGAKRIVFHPGSCSKMPRREALKSAMILLEKVLKEAPTWPEGVKICPETMGKINQLGNLDEVIEICQLDPEKIQPCVDFGHIHALGKGSLTKKEDFYNVLERIEKGLGFESIRDLHCHFSRIEYSKSGEKKHWTFKDKEHGPDFDPLAEIIYELKLEPTLICESQGTMAEDALEMKDIYLDTGKKVNQS